MIASGSPLPAGRGVRGEDPSDILRMAGNANPCQERRIMSRTLTIHLSDAQYEAIRAAAQQAKQSPEELIAAMVAARFGANGAKGQSARPVDDPVVQIMRERGHLVDPRSYPPPPRFPGMPAFGSPEWESMIQEEIDGEPEDEVDWTRINLADFVER